jgi:DNA invertase Pin-like site-specific DNA recombinase
MAAAMRDYVVKRGWTIAFEVEDVGSGTGERPRRDELLKTARQRKIAKRLGISRTSVRRLLGLSAN